MYKTTPVFSIKVLSRGFADSGSGNQFPGPDWAISGLYPDPELANVGHFPDPVGHFPDPESAFPDLSLTILGNYHQVI